MGAFVLAQIPYPHIPTSITANELALIGVYHDIVNGAAVRVIALHRSLPRIPYLHGAVFRTRDHPFPLAMKGDARDIAMVALEGQEGSWVRRADVVELDLFTTRGGEKTLVGGDA